MTTRHDARKCSYSAAATAKRHTFSCIGYSLLGYNILRGYPLADDGMDPGFASPIFRADYSTNDVTADCRYSQPAGLHVYTDVSCDTAFVSQEIKNKQEFADWIANDVQVNASDWGVQYCASAAYQQTLDKVEVGDTLLIYSQATCHHQKTRLNLHSPPPLHDDFIAAVHKLNLAPVSESDVHDFFDTYGTHFVTEMYFGARYTAQHMMTYNSYDEISQANYSVAVQAGFAAQLDHAAGSHLNHEQRQAALELQKRAHTRIHAAGAIPPASDHGVDWEAAAKKNPMPIRFKLHSIDALFTSHFMSGADGVHGYSHARKAVLAHKSTYCAGLAERLGVPNNCDVIYSGQSLVRVMARVCLKSRKPMAMLTFKNIRCVTTMR